MKLVDILARELKAWPEPKVPLNGGKDDCCQSDDTTEVYFGFGRDSVLLSKRAENTIGVSVTRAEWQAAVDALKVAEGIADAEAGNLIPLDDVKDKWASRSWNGEGLPPVGVVCEYSLTSGAVWHECTVKYALSNGRQLVADCAGNPEGEAVLHFSTCQFRTLRTPEQIAAEEIETILNWMVNRDSERGLRGIAEDLHADGYRKQVAP